jgi:hypothetical protein
MWGGDSVAKSRNYPPKTKSLSSLTDGPTCSGRRSGTQTPEGWCVSSVAAEIFPSASWMIDAGSGSLIYAPHSRGIRQG